MKDGDEQMAFRGGTVWLAVRVPERPDGRTPIALVMHHRHSTCMKISWTFSLTILLKISWNLGK